MQRARAMKMRDLERLTGVNRETIRVYFREGLLPEPGRPKPNVADYGDAHVRAILAVRELQRERRIPLTQIKRAVEGDASAMPGGAGAFAQLENLVAARVNLDEALVPLSRIEGLGPRAAEDARAFEKVRAIKIKRRDGKSHLTRTDARLLGLWGEMRAAGFNEENGFKPEVVKMYVDAAAGLARAEIAEFLSIVEGRVDETRAADLALTAIKVMLDFFGLLRMKAVLQEMKSQTATPAKRRKTSSPPRAKR